MKKLRKLISGNRYLKAVLDFAAIIIGYYIALALRFEFAVPPLKAAYLLLCAPVIILVFLIFNSYMGLYSGRWKYASFDEILNLSSASFLATAVIFVGALAIPGARTYLPLSVSVIGGVLSLFVMAFVRLQYRVLRELRLRQAAAGGKKVLLVGAGEAGEMVARDMLRHPEHGYVPVGFVDDDLAKRNLVIQGVPVMGTRHDIPRLVVRENVDEIFITIPSLQGKEVRDLISICETTDAVIKILPPLLKMARKRIGASAVREVHVDDLLGREPFPLHDQLVADAMLGSSVLITGGSGSIGSRLAHHIASFGPANLILLDNNESGLFEVENELRRASPGSKVTVEMADIRDIERLRTIFKRNRPDYIFHSAASKHVPMMELHPTEAVKNNILGTKNIAETARDYGAKGFIFFSSIKAERPDNIMGVTKNIAERMLYFMNEDGGCRFASFRLGNVLGTRGSVVTVFERLIQQGGPITLTHPDASRYFLTIDEAALMIMQACAMMEGGEIYMPDMGEPVKIKELAEGMIGLMRPEWDVEIVITGLRPGEKIQEEILLPVDGIKPTTHEKIYRLDYHFRDKERFMRDVDLLVEAAQRNDEREVKSILSRMVPTYTPKWETGEEEATKKGAGS